MRQGIKNAVLAAFDSAGFTLLPHWRVERHAAASYLARLFDWLGTDCVLDVGANVGQYRNFLRYEVGYTGRIVSFEPIPANVAQMAARAADDAGWTIVEAALGATPGRATFNVMQDTQFSSFLAPDHSSVGLFTEQNAVTAQVEVPMRTLDEVVPELLAAHAPKSFYLKLDTQGFDLEVLKGGTHALRYVRAMQSEVSVKGLYQGAPDYVTTLRTLEALGFELSGIFPNNAGHFPRLIEFDAFFVGRSALPAER